MRAMYSSSNSATHHIFFPPRLQVVAFQQDPDGFSPDPWYQLAAHALALQESGTRVYEVAAGMVQPFMDDLLSTRRESRLSCG